MIGVEVLISLLAYTDPGSGALLWQMLLAGSVSVLFYFRRIRSWFRVKKKDPEN